MLRFLVLFFVAFAANAASVTLAWDEPVDPRITGYYLYHSNAQTMFYTTPPIDVGKTSSFVVTGLATGVPHWFVMTSYAGAPTLPILGQDEPRSNELRVYIEPTVNVVPIDFGTLSLLYTSRTRVVTVTNNDTVPLTIGTIRYAGNGVDFGPRGSTCAPGAVVPPSQSCTLAYVFRPTRPGTRSIEVTATSTADTYVLRMTGVGRGFVLLPETLDYGAVQRGQYPERTLTFKALWPLTISNIVKGGSAFTITNSTCVTNTPMIKDQTCSMTVKMVGMTAGFKGGSLRFETDVGVGTAGFRATVQ